MTTETRPKPLTANTFWHALVDAGVIRKDEDIARIVIDVKGPNDLVMMYIERYGDERLLDVVTTLDGIEIRGVPKEPTVA